MASSTVANVATPWHRDLQLRKRCCAPQSDYCTRRDEAEVFDRAVVGSFARATIEPCLRAHRGRSHVVRRPLGAGVNSSAVSFAVAQVREAMCELPAGLTGRSANRRGRC
jgi:hypothetical protein